MAARRTLALFAVLASAVAGTTAAAGAPRPGGGEEEHLLPRARRTEWRPGIPGGVPRSTKTCWTLDATAFGDGVADATAAIQTALDSCPLGQAVVLPAGTYRTTGVVWLRRGVVLRGEGPRTTRIRRDGAGGDRGGVVLRIGNGAAFGEVVSVTADVPLGDRRLPVSSTDRFRPGDFVHVDERDDPDRIVTGDCTWFKRMDGTVARSVGQRAEIASVEPDAIVLATPMHAPLHARLRPEVVRLSPQPVRDAGIEDLYVTGGVGANVDVQSAAYSWIRNVESDAVWGRHVSLSGCYRCVVRDSYVHHASHGYASGANAYGISLNSQTSDTLVENNIVDHLNKPVTFEASGGGNVVAYNYVDDPVLGQMPTWQELAIDGAHCSHPHQELVEGNWAPHIGAAATHGNASGLTFFRNFASSRARTVVHVGNVEAVQLDAGMRDMNVLGNVLSAPGIGARYEPTPDPRTPGTYAWRTLTWPPPKVYLLGGWARGDSPQNFDERVAATLLRHGNFDYATRRVLWDPRVPGRALPASLYLSERPDFFGDERWPWVEPERAPRVHVLPAKRRFEAMRAR